MGTFKRILAGLVIFTSVLGLVLCLAGIIGVWVINQSLTERLTDAFDQVINVLVLSQDRLDQVDANLIEAQNLIASQQEAVNETGEQLTENSPTLTLLSNTVGMELIPKLETTAEVIGTMRDTIVSVNSTLENVNSVPFVSVPSLPMEQFNAIDQQMQELVVSVKSLGETVKDIETGVVDRTTAVILIPLQELDELIDQVHTPTVAFNTRLAHVENGLVDASARIPALIDWGSIIMTLVMAWLILAQFSLLYSGWYYWKTGTIPAIHTPLSQNLSGTK